MKRVLLACLALAACEKQDDASWRMAASENAIRVLETRMAEQEAEIAALRDEVANVRAVTLGTSEHAASIAEQVANNAKVANENAAKDMTEAGACGFNPGYRDAETGIFYGPTRRECTVADLKKNTN